LSEGKAFSLDRVTGQWQEFMLKHDRVALDKQWMDNFKQLLREVSAGVDTFTLKGAKVAMFVPGQLNKALLASERPDIIDRFTEMVVEQKFNAIRFAKEEPELFARYRAQRLVLVEEKRNK
jgi:hypothetical protein